MDFSADLSAALPSFVVTLREGVEAALVVGIVLACLAKAHQEQLNRWVYLGIGAGLGASLGVGLFLSWGLAQVQRSNSPWAQLLDPTIKTLLCGLAIALLSWMLIWMTRQARSLRGEIEGSITQQLAQPSAQAGWSVFSLVFVAVLREGFEAVVFILTSWQQGATAAQASASGGMASLGALGGLLGATAIGFGLFRFGLRINLGRFFQVMGLLLLLIVAGLVISLGKNLDAALGALNPLVRPELCPFQSSCILGPLLWDSSAWLPDGRWPGLLLKTLLGYRDHLYGLQAIAYGAFWLGVGGLYFRSLSSGRAGSASQAASQAEPSTPAES
jgi:high-affinity iron transporter